MLLRSIEPGQFTAIRYGERLAELGALPSIGSVGDSYDNALAETVNGLYKTEVIRRRGPWRNVDEVELATLEWVHWSRYAGDPPTVGAGRPGWVMWPSCRAWSAPTKVLAVA